MGIYSSYIFPRLMNWGMSQKTLAPYRKEVLSHARGKVLELGFGTGLNLPYYPAQVHELHGVEVNAGMRPLARKRLARAPMQVSFHLLDAEQLPFAPQSFDTVVSTWTLCSIPHIGQALAEVYRVLKPDGRFLFVEHGLSPEPGVQKWQHRLTPVQKVIGQGCHLDRNMEALISEAGFTFNRLRKEYAPGSPKLAGYFYIGIASKQATSPHAQKLT
jgi:ubiquinone/menaquinone biosynthesis C-methylase UbiE